MKTNETYAAPMDEIVFKNRNKEYGAYVLRKKYNKTITRALLMATAIMLAGLAYPIISSYKHKNLVLITNDDGPVIFDATKLPDQKPPELPKLPDEMDKVKEKLVFRPPVVTDEPIDESEGLLNQDELNKITTNTAVDDIKDAPQAEPTDKAPVIDVDNIDHNEPILIAEEMPMFPGGDVERQKFLGDNIKYPQQASETGIQGTVYISFIVDTKGNITDVKVMRGIGGGCDEEAIRVIKLMPQWKPGKQNGKNVRVIFNMPVFFKLN